MIELESGQTWECKKSCDLFGVKCSKGELIYISGNGERFRTGKNPFATMEYFCAEGDKLINECCRLIVPAPKKEPFWRSGMQECPPPQPGGYHSDLYNDTVKPLSESALRAAEDIFISSHTPPSMPVEDRIFYSDYSLTTSGTYSTMLGCGYSYNWTIPAPYEPKFKKGDIFKMVRDSCRADAIWNFEKDELFYVKSSSNGVYSLRVIYSECGTNKDFAVAASDIDTDCELLNNSDKSSNSYFPLLSNV